MRRIATLVLISFPFFGCVGVVGSSERLDAGAQPGTGIAGASGNASGGTGGPVSTGGVTGIGTGGASGMSGGRSGSGGSPGIGGMTGGTTGSMANLPCDVQAVYQAHCISCHASPPVGGAPMPLVSYANLTAPSLVNPAMTFAQRTVVRMQSASAPMPPAPGTPATTTEIQIVNNWIAAGYPSGTCGGGGGGGGNGGGGAPDGGAPDPLGAAATCTSHTTWTGGNNGDPLMNPGRACISCHAGNGEAPQFTIAGTLYPTGHEPDLCNGVNGTNGARVVITDATNRTITLTPNAAGNFTYTGTVATPYLAKVTFQGRERIMPVAQTSGDCNACHTQTGASAAPGRITLP